MFIKHFRISALSQLLHVSLYLSVTLDLSSFVSRLCCVRCIPDYLLFPVLVEELDLHHFLFTVAWVLGWRCVYFERLCCVRKSRCSVYFLGAFSRRLT